MLKFSAVNLDRINFKNAIKTCLKEARLGASFFSEGDEFLSTSFLNFT